MKLNVAGVGVSAVDGRQAAFSAESESVSGKYAHASHFLFPIGLTA
jgi:hypothetical protein